MIDLIEGADGIAKFLFGEDTQRLRRQVYHLAESHDLPAFKIGNKLYARKARLAEWIEARENEAPSA
ncbi:helix-turn-helix domain-containing protein [Bradyrhizobium sp. CCBAU 51765]|uniref:helix-turn-helix domain-containing protein n=1 Tax=Bradyrhizobium sp. CCBAU 51765 TaxID=1325102 RepID=UPI001888391F|nr:helix-turn-helix domain-containing protein [Bradyrhizobium sp. CCBAU 51765]QOZ06666.1 DNA-binding protein [Bradyrhizobium sp. CCBAU 51765]